MLLILSSLTSALPASQLTKQAIPPTAQTNSLPSLVDFAWQVTDPNQGNAFIGSGKDYLHLWNNGGSTRTVTITSYPEPTLNRLGDLTKTILAGNMAVIGPIPKLGFWQGDGMIYFLSSSADVQANPMTYL